jgi:hypothetical protein
MQNLSTASCTRESQLQINKAIQFIYEMALVLCCRVKDGV